MMVARHEMPGKRGNMIRPVGNGVIRSATSVRGQRQNKYPYQPIIPFPTGRLLTLGFQAFHAWLPSFRPSGTRLRFL